MALTDGGLRRVVLVLLALLVSASMAMSVGAMAAEAKSCKNANDTKRCCRSKTEDPQRAKKCVDRNSDSQDTTPGEGNTPPED